MDMVEYCTWVCICLVPFVNQDRSGSILSTIIHSLRSNVRSNSKADLDSPKCTAQADLDDPKLKICSANIVQSVLSEIIPKINENKDNRPAVSGKIGATYVFDVTSFPISPNQNISEEDYVPGYNPPLGKDRRSKLSFNKLETKDLSLQRKPSPRTLS